MKNIARFIYTYIYIYNDHLFCIIVAVLGVAMARHGLLLRESEATSLTKVPKYLMGLRDTILCPKFVTKIKIAR